MHRGGETFSLVETKEHEPHDILSIPIQAGDALVAFTAWDGLARLARGREFVVVTTDFPREEMRPKKVGWALFFFAIALGLILFSEVRLSLALLVGATGMIVSRVLRVDEAYGAVSWSTVFLLASLIPLGQAVQNTGTAAWIAHHVMLLLEAGRSGLCKRGSPCWRWRLRW